MVVVAPGAHDFGSNFFPPALAIARRLPIIGPLLRLPPGLDRLVERVVNSGRASNA
jgi:hypothetical protein